MERTQAIERLMAALAPTVQAEVERTLEEAQQRLDLEYEIRLQQAALDGEARARETMEAEIARAKEEAADSARREVTTALESQISNQLEEARREARESLKADLDAVNQQAEGNWAAEREQLTRERARLTEQLAEWRLLAGAEIRLVEADSQMEMLARFLKLAAAFSDSIAVYVARPEGLNLWKSRGTAAFPSVISPETAGPDRYFRSIVARGRPVAAIAAAGPVLRRDALDFLSACLERSITLLGLKLQNPSSAASGQPPAEALHSDAREAARTLVSEIKSNREQDVLEGRVNADLYQRLHDDIETARGQYLERVPLGIAVSRDYFDEELIRELTENHPALMGAGYTGSPD